MICQKEKFWRKFLMSSIESSYPEMCSHEYRNMLPCPALSTNLSRLSHEGFLGSIFSISPKSTAPISAQPSGRPKCPDEHALIASIASPRASFAAFWSISLLFVVIPVCC